LTEPELVQLAKDGDNKAFDKLVIKYSPKLRNTLLRIVGDQDVEDVLQEAWIRVWGGLSSFRGDSSFYTWLYRVAINSAKNHLISKSRRPSAFYQIDSEEMPSFETPEDKIAAEELNDYIQSIFEDLPEEQKESVSLYELELKPYEDIAKEVDIPIGTVRSRIFRARQTIKKKIGDFNDEDY